MDRNKKPWMIAAAITAAAGLCLVGVMSPAFAEATPFNTPATHHAPQASSNHTAPHVAAPKKPTIAPKSKTVVTTQKVQSMGSQNPTQTLTCSDISVDYHRALVNGDHINLQFDPGAVQVHVYVDQNIAGGYTGSGWNGAGLRFTDASGHQTTAPLTKSEIDSGVIVFNYPSYLGTTTYTVTWVQSDSTDTTYSLSCPPSTPPTHTSHHKAYVCVVWQLVTEPADSTSPTYPQNIVRGSIVYESSPTLCPAPTTCGTWYQVDVYHNVSGLQALLKAGVLNGPIGVEDSQYLVSGTWGTAYQLTINADCPPPVDEDATANVTSTDATCSLPLSPGSATVTDLNEATLTSVDGSPATTLSETPGDHTAEFTSASSHTFSNGSTTLDVPYNVPNAKTLTECYAPQACVASGAWAIGNTEDLPPAQRPAGAEFKGPQTPAVDTYQDITGNMQGFSSLHYQVASIGSGYTARLVLEGHSAIIAALNPVSDPSGFFTASTAQEAVVGDNDARSYLWYTSKIPYASAGGQGDPVTYDALAAIIPDNILQKIGLHLQSGSTADSDSVVASVTTSSSTCGGNFTQTVDPAAPHADITSACSADSTTDGVTIVLSNPYTPSAGHVGTAATFYVTVDSGTPQNVGTIQPGGADLTITSDTDSELTFATGTGDHSVVVTSGGVTIASATASSNTCDIVVTPVAPTPPVQSTCVDGKSIPGSAETFAELQAAQPTGIVLTLEKDNVTVDVSAAAGYALKDGSPTTLTLPAVPASKTCITPTKILAYTGGAIIGTIGLEVALSMLLLGAFAVYMRRRFGRA